jgi:hypothetical protein
MPLAVVAGRVAGVRERFTDGHFPLRQTVGDAAKRHRMRAGTNRPSAGHETGAARRALRLHVRVQEAHAILGQRVDARRSCTTRDATPINPNLAVTEVVGQNENNVGFLVRRKCRAGDASQTNKDYDEHI